MYLIHDNEALRKECADAKKEDSEDSAPSMLTPHFCSYAFESLISRRRRAMVLSSSRNGLAHAK
eukprot:scaffold233175_cov37-Tisochrysis_lutea.AAC.1